MEKLAIILMKEPYGDIDAAEAVRHALGAVSNDIEVSMVLTDAGVFLARKGQVEGDTGFMNLGESLSDCVDMGVEVYAESGSLERANLNAGEIIDGVKIVNSAEVAGLLAQADQALIY